VAVCVRVRSIPANLLEKAALALGSLLLFSGTPMWPVARLTAKVASSRLLHRKKKEVKVWVNTASGVYHCPGTRWYGKTKQGKYMKECAARKSGYRPAYHHNCGSLCSNREIACTIRPNTILPRPATEATF
jgi:hypothetical protein